MATNSLAHGPYSPQEASASFTDSPEAELSTLPNQAKAPLSPLAEHKYRNTEAKQVFVAFLEDYLEIEFQGFQPGFKNSPDLILFLGPHRSTLAVPVSLMLETRDAALAAIRQKKATAEHKFSNSFSEGKERAAERRG